MMLKMWTTLFLVAGVTADLPVHCLRHQVEGEWRFELGKSRARRTSCGHARPDAEDKQPQRSLFASADQLMVMLREPNVAATGRDDQGSWTMVYDEGFEVKVAGLTFFAFSNFTYEGPSKHNVSHCGDTMVGWYRNEDRTLYGCYYATKIAQEPPRTVLSTMKHQTQVTVAGHDTPMDHAAQKRIVSKVQRKIELAQLGWTARAMPKWHGRTRREVNAYAGIQRGGIAETRKEMLAQRDTPPKARSFLGRSTTLPKAWDWSNLSGRNFLEPVMDQGDCGSCYVVASMRMLTARHKIKTNTTEALPWSINFPLQCSEYNQGCSGGYGLLITKWSDDVGLLPATCMRYDTAGSCKLECDLDKLEGPRYRAGNHRYVGQGWYGNSSAEAIRQELFTNGPLVLGLEPAEDFMYYSEGVYKSPEKVLHVTNQEWEKVDHAVLLVGWGEEDGQPYWRLQNSWGPDWGEEGFFRIARGEDESGIESIPEAADVVEDTQAGLQVSSFFQEMSEASSLKKPISRH